MNVTRQFKYGRIWTFLALIWTFSVPSLLIYLSMARETITWWMNHEFAELFVEPNVWNVIKTGRIHWLVHVWRIIVIWWIRIDSQRDSISLSAIAEDAAIARMHFVYCVDGRMNPHAERWLVTWPCQFDVPNPHQRKEDSNMH